MTTSLSATDASAIDPFDLDFLRDPLPAHALMRDAGPVVLLEKYGVYAMARYDEVHAALVDWQSFQSAAGVGLANFRVEEPWRPPSVLLEADPPRHDAPRAVVEPLISGRALRHLEERWRGDAATVVDELLARGDEFDAVTDLAEVFPLRVFPDAVGIGTEGRENLLPYGDFAFNAFGPQNALVTAAAPHMAPVMGWIGEQCQRENLTAGGFGAQIWAAADRGEITEQYAPMIVRSLLTAGVDTTV
ncbi:MAG: cytochrome P450, partial [Actinobacteria bacterium]|nr:cytochrome P450 [Actinomycetota bacterium]